MASQMDASGCFIFLTIVMGLVFWPVSLMLIFVGLIVSLIGFFQDQTYSEYASKWEKLHVSNPCAYSGKYGFISGVKTEGNNIKLFIRPIDDLLHPLPEAVNAFSTKIVDGSFQHSMRQLFKQNSIEFFIMFAELSARGSFECQQQLAWCESNESFSQDVRPDRSCRSTLGNPL